MGDRTTDRRQALRSGIAAVAALAGCIGGSGGGDSDDEDGTTTGGDGTPVTMDRNVDPAATYLHTNEDEAADAEPISLSRVGVEPGQEVTLRRLGSYDKQGSGGKGMIAVFSGSDRLLGAGKQHRLPDAVDAGEDYETEPTFNGNEPTDIPEDFLVAGLDGSDPSVTLAVPDGASHLFAAVPDTLYQDNTDENGDFGLRITTG